MIILSLREAVATKQSKNRLLRLRLAMTKEGRLAMTKGFSIIEYCILIIIILSSLLVMQDLIKRAFNGHWKAAGESFGFGRQYSPSKTVECAYSQINADYGAWYDNNCYQGQITHCQTGNLVCEDVAKKSCCQNYCCEDNQEPSGHSNCSGTGKQATCVQ